MELFAALYRVLTHPQNRRHKPAALLRIIWWKINQLFFRHPAVIELAPGIKCICYPQSSFGAQIIYTTYPEYHEMKFTQAILRPKDVFLDVGAGLGDYSLIAASKIKKGRIWSFEPDPVSLRFLKENIALNRLGNRIHVISKIVSDKDGYEYFISNQKSELSHISKKSSGLRLSSIRLDSFIKKTRLKKIRLVKIDVEGAELMVLEGLNKSLLKKIIDFMIIEVNNRSPLYDDTAPEVFSLLKKGSYVVYIFDNKHKLIKLTTKMKIKKGIFNILAVKRTKSNLKRIREFVSS